MCHSPTPGTFCSLFGFISTLIHNITSFVTWSGVNFPLVVITFVQHLSDHRLTVPLKGRVSPTKPSFHPATVFSSSTGFPCVAIDCLLCVSRPHVSIVLLFHVMTYCTCLVRLPRTISYYDHLHFTCCLTGFPSQNGVRIS